MVSFENRRPPGFWSNPCLWRHWVFPFWFALDEGGKKPRDSFTFIFTFTRFIDWRHYSREDPFARSIFKIGHARDTSLGSPLQFLRPLAHCATQVLVWYGPCKCKWATPLVMQQINKSWLSRCCALRKWAPCLFLRLLLSLLPHVVALLNIIFGPKGHRLRYMIEWW